jgi:hypothetical protein
MIGTKKPWDILEKPPRCLDDFLDADDFPEEAGAFALEARPLPGDREVLARETADEQITLAFG